MLEAVITAGAIRTRPILLTAAALMVGAFVIILDPIFQGLAVSLLFGVEPTDPSTLAAVTATIATVAALACGLPAWRASRVDPNVVLREG